MTECVKLYVSQVLVYANKPPNNGTCSIVPTRGVALATVFTAACRYFQDPDGHLPLTYQLLVIREGQRMALSAITNRSSIEVRDSSASH